MAMQATDDLPAADRYVFILRQDIAAHRPIRDALSKAFPESQIVMLDGQTDGQARTCLLALNSVNPDAPLTIGACDNGVVFNQQRFEDLMNDDNVDVIVWAACHHPNALAHPEMYGWIQTDNGTITSVYVKQPPADPKSSSIVIGTFTFKKAVDFRRAASRLIERDGIVNGELYVDSVITDATALGLNCIAMDVDAYLCWGTPDELRTFEYWQSCFHKWGGHPYRLENDVKVSPNARQKLEQRYAPTNPGLPGDPN